jgi:hypothetical protein
MVLEGDDQPQDNDNQQFVAKIKSEAERVGEVAKLSRIRLHSDIV